MLPQLLPHQSTQKRKVKIFRLFPSTVGNFRRFPHVSFRCIRGESVDQLARRCFFFFCGGEVIYLNRYVLAAPSLPDHVTILARWRGGDWRRQLVPGTYPLASASNPASSKRRGTLCGGTCSSLSAWRPIQNAESALDTSGKRRAPLVLSRAHARARREMRRGVRCCLGFSAVSFSLRACSENTRYVTVAPRRAPMPFVPAEGGV